VKKLVSPKGPRMKHEAKIIYVEVFVD
jgi:hypothetical protein